MMDFLASDDGYADDGYADDGDFSSFLGFHDSRFPEGPFERAAARPTDMWPAPDKSDSNDSQHSSDRPKCGFGTYFHKDLNECVAKHSYCELNNQCYKYTHGKPLDGPGKVLVNDSIFQQDKKTSTYIDSGPCWNIGVYPEKDGDCCTQAHAVFSKHGFCNVPKKTQPPTLLDSRTNLTKDERDEEPT